MVRLYHGFVEISSVYLDFPVTAIGVEIMKDSDFAHRINEFEHSWNCLRVSLC